MKFRKMTWAIWIWSILCIAWVFGGISSVEECVPGDSACEVGTAIGAGIGIFMIGFIWFLGFIVLSIIWFMTRPSRKSE